MSAQPDLATALATAATSLHMQPSLSSALQAIVDVARDSLPDVDHVGISLQQRDRPLRTDAATDPLVLELDRIQYELHEGPCVTALDDPAQPVVVANFLTTGDRWPDFAARVRPHGVRSILALRLFNGEETVGVLNMYSTSSDLIGEETRLVAELLATHAAFAYGHIRRTEQMRAALETRELIAKAIGIVMQRFSLTHGRAFEYLVGVAATSGTKLRAVAGEVVRELESSDGSPLVLQPLPREGPL